MDTAQVQMPSPGDERLSRARKVLPYWAENLLLVMVILAAFVAGLEIRQTVWEESAPVRFRDDIRNAYRHGTNVIRLAREQRNLTNDQVPSWPATFVAYLHFYDKIRDGWSKEDSDPNSKAGPPFDYPPMRFMVMTAWTRATYQSGAPVEPSDLPAVRPLLYLNNFAALMAAVGAALLVRHWLGRAEGSVRRRTDWLAVACGALVWCNIGLIMNSHGWLQWDVWVLPFYFFAMYAASRGRWLTVGLLVGIGSMFKGQLLVVSLILVLWPLFCRQWRGALRVVVGFVAMWALIQLMWIFIWPWKANAMLAGLLIAIGVLRWKLPQVFRSRAELLIFAISASVFLTALTFDRFSWVHRGFLFGVQQAESEMGMAFRGANNLGAILQKKYGWTQPKEVVGTISIAGRSVSITIGQLMKGTLFACLVACAAALARHSRHNDPRALMAIAAPLLLFYALLPHMSTRYSCYGAATTALAVGIGLGPTLIHLLLSIHSAATIFYRMIDTKANRDWWPDATKLLSGMYPDTGWVTLMCAAIVLYLAVTPSRRITGRTVSAQSQSTSSAPR